MDAHRSQDFGPECDGQAGKDDEKSGKHISRKLTINASESIGLPTAVDDDVPVRSDEGDGQCQAESP